MARSRKLVVDASVVVKWYVEEEYSAQALKIFEDYSDGKFDLLSVHLMPFEVLNALRYNPAMGVRDIERAGESLSRSQITLFPILDGLYLDSIRIATEYGITIYDSTYLALAESAECDLCTADEKFVKRIESNGNLKLLRDM